MYVFNKAWCVPYLAVWADLAFCKSDSIDWVFVTPSGATKLVEWFMTEWVYPIDRYYDKLPIHRIKWCFQARSIVVSAKKEFPHHGDKSKLEIIHCCLYVDRQTPTVQE